MIGHNEDAPMAESVYYALQTRPIAGGLGGLGLPDPPGC